MRRFFAFSRVGKRIAYASATAAIIALVAMPGTAMASSAKSDSPQLIPTVSYNYRMIHKTNQGNHTGDWVVCGVGINDTNINGVNFTCSETVTTTTSYSLTGGYSPSEVSGSIGFNITRSYTYSKTLSLNVPLPAHTQAEIQFGIYYTQFRGEMEKQRCVHANATVCGSWGDGHWVTVQKAIAPAIRATGEKHYP